MPGNDKIMQRRKKDQSIDGENPEWTKEDFARARPACEIVPEIVAAYRRARAVRKNGPRNALYRCVSIPT